MKSSIWNLLIIRSYLQKVQHLKFIHKLDEFIEHHNDEIEDQDDEQIMVICVESADRG